MAGIAESELFVYDSRDIRALLDFIQNEKFIVKYENKEFS